MQPHIARAPAAVPRQAVPVVLDTIEAWLKEHKEDNIKLLLVESVKSYALHQFEAQWKVRGCARDMSRPRIRVNGRCHRSSSVFLRPGDGPYQTPPPLELRCCDVLRQALPVSKPAELVLWSSGSALTSCIMSRTVHHCDTVTRCETCGGCRCLRGGGASPRGRVRRPDRSAVGEGASGTIKTGVPMPRGDCHRT